MMKILLLNGSPRGKLSTSFSFSTYMQEQFEAQKIETSILNVRNQLNSEENIGNLLSEIDSSDVIMLIAPLYIDSPPFIVIKLMEIIAESKMELKDKRFFPIVNCGFPETEHITAVSIPIYHKFAEQVGIRWTGSLTIPMGEIYQGKQGRQLKNMGKMANKMRAVLEEVVTGISSNKDLPDMVPNVFPGIFNWKLIKKVFLKMGNKSWRQRIEEKGEDPDAKPYLE